jgi:chemotaxis protein MotB
MRRRRSKDHVSHDRWLVSFADFITLLFAFFVVLYSASKADIKKQMEFADAIDSAFTSLGLFPNANARSTTVMAQEAEQSAFPVKMNAGDQPLIPEQVQHDFKRMQMNLEGLLSNQIAQHTVAVHIGREGLVISLREAGFFDSGSAVPQSDTVPILDRIALALLGTPYDVRIEGHTDNVPIHTGQYDSNWELSAARATKLARIFIEDHDFAPTRLSAAGFAEVSPGSLKHLCRRTTAKSAGGYYCAAARQLKFVR